jgi:hypothetical protein
VRRSQPQLELLDGRGLQNQEKDDTLLVKPLS